MYMCSSSASRRGDYRGFFGIFKSSVDKFLDLSYNSDNRRFYLKVCSKCGLNKEDKNFHKDGKKLRSECKECHAKSKKRYVELYPEKELLRLARYRAKRDGLEFNLVPEDITIPKLCPILKISLKKSGGSNSPSLDRIDNSKGYIKGNVAVISFRANSHKGDMTVKQVERLLKYMKGELDVG